MRALIQGPGEFTDDPLAAAALSTCFQVLEALAQLAMHVGLGVGDIRSLSESAFLCAAQSLLAEEGGTEPDNVAKLAVRTGYNRNTVGKLLKGRSSTERQPPFQHPTARVMRAWQSSPGYFEGKRIPKILPLRGEPPSFYALTKATIGDDLPPKLILKDLHRIGAVKSMPNKRVQLVRSTYGSAAWDAEQVQQMGAEVSDHVRALLQLLQQRQPAPFRRYITQAGLGAENAAILARELSHSAEVLMEGHKRALNHETNHSRQAPGQKHRLGALMLVYREPDPQGQPPVRLRSAPKTRARKSTAPIRTKRV